MLNKFSRVSLNAEKNNKNRNSLSICRRKIHKNYQWTVCIEQTKITQMTIKYTGLVATGLAAIKYGK